MERFHATQKDDAHPSKPAVAAPLRAVYLGSMGSGYDLMTAIKVAARWKEEDRFPWQIHFAGAGPLLEQLQKESQRLGLATTFKKTDQSVPTNVHETSDRVIFHGLLKKEAVNKLLLSADIALVTNRPGSLVACPYKAGEYTAAGLPVLSCLKGELGALLHKWDAGYEYQENDPASLHSIFEKYSNDPGLINKQSGNARNLANALFDRSITYPLLAKFIVE